ncbi:hypothetical protein [Microbacterium sp. zg.Y909]|uniref:hypothetical protein n=1 Tax=Microbacterium sp. zg.Y909 TaxID=2969413 RepID=UPI00214BE0DC|nr:hypothetical protein [Microbacterium sp. zg.Y909]MCR2826297.1 hypothetical protein [Microbacterium sp. zg.Y909]
MSALNLLRSAAGAALLVNAVPHGVAGVQGTPFPSPFSDPPGVGLSSPAVNVAWSAANLFAGRLLMERSGGTAGERAVAALAATGMALVLAAHFGRVLGGSRRVRR